MVHRYRHANPAPSSPPPPPGAAATLQPQPQPSQKKKGGLETELLKLMKRATKEREVAAGRWTPHGQVTKGGRLLQARAAAKRELQEIQGRLSGVC